VGLFYLFWVEDEDASPYKIKDATLWLVTLVFHYISWYQSRLYPDYGQLAQQWRPSPTTPLVEEGLFWEPNSWGIWAGIIRIWWPTYTTVTTSITTSFLREMLFQEPTTSDTSNDQRHDHNKHYIKSNCKWYGNSWTISCDWWANPFSLTVSRGLNSWS